MYYIIESKNQLNYLTENPKESCFLNLVPLSDNFHPKLSSPCLMYFKPTGDKAYILCINHPDSFSLDFEDIIELLNKYKTIYCLDKKFHLYFLPHTLNLIDLNFIKLNKDNNIFDLSHVNTKVHSYFNKEFKENFEVNKLIPIPKHFEKYENIYGVIKDFIGNEIPTYYDNEYTQVFYDLEKNGIKINPVQFYKNFDPNVEEYSVKDDIIYTSYNLYNLTTRPSNVFNNINFSSLTKDTRISFIPRNDMFIEYDYDGYHPRLIGDTVGYKFTDESAHKQLTQLYFPEIDISGINKELVDIAKHITFKLLYGNVSDEYSHVEFLQKVNTWIDVEWQKFNELGYFTLKDGRRIYNKNIQNFRKNKLLSWFIQSYETYRNTTVLVKLNNLLATTKSKLVYNMYDSFLIDFAKSDGRNLLNNIKETLEVDGFPVKIHYGSNYKELSII